MRTTTLATVLLGITLVSPACGKKLADGERAPGAADLAAPATAASTDAPGVQAGEWDDNANYRDYQAWLKEMPRGIARLDPSGRQFLVVEDSAGKPVPNCKIAVAGTTRHASLVTMASGRAILFPRALGLDGDELTATTTCDNATASATIDPSKLDGVTVLQLASARTLPARRAVDLAFVLDTTGSMSEEIAAVRSTIVAVSKQLGTEQVDVRVGMVTYKDRTDDEVTHTYAFSSDLAAFGNSVEDITASGGGDYPEDMHAGLTVALDGLAWRDDAVARMIVVIADAPPHLDYQERDYADSARRASARGIKLFTVSASGMDGTGQIVMRQMAQFTGASSMFVLRGGAGPQSTGGGDPMAACGGTHTDYASGKLDALIVGKVELELASIDDRPLRIAGLGQDESARPCAERTIARR